MLAATSIVLGLSITGCAVGPITESTAGLIPLTDVLDADPQLLSQEQLAPTRANTDQAAVRSFRTIGGGWAHDS